MSIASILGHPSRGMGPVLEEMQTASVLGCISSSLFKVAPPFPLNWGMPHPTWHVKPCQISKRRGVGILNCSDREHFLWGSGRDWKVKVSGGSSPEQDGALGHLPTAPKAPQVEEGGGASAAGVSRSATMDAV